MGGEEINAFLIHLVVKGNVVASTQNQALSALLFLYREILNQELDLKLDSVRAKQIRHLPTVPTVEEARAVIRHLSGVYRLIVQLLYGSGLCLTEALQLRTHSYEKSFCVSCSASS